MGDFADKFAALGKHRLLQLEHIRKKAQEESPSEFNSCYDLFRESVISNKGLEETELEENSEKVYSYETTDDPFGEDLKIHVDAFITLKRFQKKGIDFLNFEQAAIMASDKGRAIYVKEIEEIKKVLEQKDDQEQWFEEYLMDRMPPLTNHSSGSNKSTLVKVLNDFVSFYETINFDDPDWIREQKRNSEVISLTEAAFKFIKKLQTKLEINISEASN